MKKIFLAAALAVGFASQAMASTVYFSDNFANLDAWTRKPGNSSAYVSNNMLSFYSGNSAGDIFTTQTFDKGYINFNYRGAAGADGGGYFGISTGFPDNHYWLAGSSSSYYTPVKLINDGQFHHYSIAFDSAVIGAPAHLMFEQFANYTPSMSAFANVSVTDVPAVPEPETYAMMVAGLAALAVLRRRKSA